ncbi:MAG TPA: hypothetical protein VL996_02665, partial [Methylocella sp.]|nr:hypothetical protein [Methylocella sp.]
GAEIAGEHGDGNFFGHAKSPEELARSGSVTIENTSARAKLDKCFLGQEQMTEGFCKGGFGYTIC